MCVVCPSLFLQAARTHNPFFLFNNMINYTITSSEINDLLGFDYVFANCFARIHYVLSHLMELKHAGCIRWGSYLKIN